MNKAKEKTSAMAVEMQKIIKELLREHIVGVVGETTEGELIFTLPGGDSFQISVR